MCLFLVEGLGKGYDEISRGLKDGYNVTSKDAVNVLTQIGASTKDVAKVLSGVFHLSTKDIKDTFNSVGYLIFTLR